MPLIPEEEKNNGLEVQEKSSLPQLEDIFLFAKNAEKGCSFLFVGEDKQAMVAVALELAKALNCVGEKNGLLYCGQCAYCVMAAKAQHPDIEIFEPKGTSAHIKIEDIRRLKERINFKPYIGRKKVFIVKDAALLTAESANAMLKTLEEPFADSIIVLIAENPNQLLPTVVSRCQIYRFIDSLVSANKFPEETGEFIYKFFEALELKAVSEIAGKIASLERLEIERFLLEVSFSFRDMLLIKLGAGDVLQMSQQAKGLLTRWSDCFTASGLKKNLEETLKIKDYIHKNANIKLAVDIFFKSIQFEAGNNSGIITIRSGLC